MISLYIAKNLLEEGREIFYALLTTGFIGIGIYIVGTGNGFYTFSETATFFWLIVDVIF